MHAKMNNTIHKLRSIKHRPMHALLMVIWAKRKRGYRTASMFPDMAETVKVSTTKRSQLF